MSKSISILILFACTTLIAAAQETVTDHEGNTYKTKMEGKRLWMAENLKVTKFANGDPIPEAKTKEEWAQAGKDMRPAWCHHMNDTANGMVYNWYAVSDERGLAPDGWHVPDKDEGVKLWKELTHEAHTKDFVEKYWYFHEHNWIGAGHRYWDGDFHIELKYDWWTKDGADMGYSGYLVSGAKSSARGGYSVRCVKDKD